MVLANQYIASIKHDASLANAKLDAAEQKRMNSDRMLQTILQVNADQTVALEEMKKQREIDSLILGKLTDRLVSIDQQSQLGNATLRKLEQSNASVKNYMDTPIPVELRGLLNGGATPTKN